MIKTYCFECVGISLVLVLDSECAGRSLLHTILLTYVTIIYTCYFYKTAVTEHKQLPQCAAGYQLNSHYEINWYDMCVVLHNTTRKTRIGNISMTPKLTLRGRVN